MIDVQPPPQPGDDQRQDWRAWLSTLRAVLNDFPRGVSLVPEHQAQIVTGIGFGPVGLRVNDNRLLTSGRHALSPLIARLSKVIDAMPDTVSLVVVRTPATDWCQARLIERPPAGGWLLTAEDPSAIVLSTIEWPAGASFDIHTAKGVGLAVVSALNPVAVARRYMVSARRLTDGMIATGRMAWTMGRDLTRLTGRPPGQSTPAASFQQQAAAKGLTGRDFRRRNFTISAVGSLFALVALWAAGLLLLNLLHLVEGQLAGLPVTTEISVVISLLSAITLFTALAFRCAYTSYQIRSRSFTMARRFMDSPWQWLPVHFIFRS